MNDRVRTVLLGVAVVVLLGAIGVAVATGTGAVGGADPDRVTMERLLARPAEDLGGVTADAAAITDPVVKQAAVLEWIRRNQGHIDITNALALCESLGGIATDTCARRVDSPHLRTRPPQ